MALLHCLADRIRTQPEATALVAGDEHVTYATLGGMALAARAEIEALRLPPGPIAIYAAKSVRTIGLLIGSLLAHKAIVLVSTELGPDDLDTLLNRIGCTDLLTAEPVGRGHHVDCASRGERPAADHRVCADDDVTFLLATSGTTGPPKVVPLTVGAVDRYTDATAARYDIRPGTIVLNHSPLHSVLSLLEVWTTLKAGGTSVLVPRDRHADGPYLTELVRANGVEVLQGVPLLYRLLACHDTPFTSVRRAIVTGDRIQAPLLGALSARFPRAGIYNVYGCTETNSSFLHEVGAECTALPIGTPLPGVSAVLVDSDGTVVTGPGSGELWVHTPFQAAGYLAPTGTSAGFVRLAGDPRRYFRSGDVVRRDSHGVHTLLGRDDRHVRVRGMPVNLTEIEDVFLDHGRVAEAVVVGVPDSSAGLRIHAVVRGTGPGSVDGLSLRAHCRLRLPHAAIPATIRVVDDPLPTTDIGKVDRRAVRDLVPRS
jgi:acyl-coenzyme A synthetase/AMP-(fatty) acid ligase